MPIYKNNQKISVVYKGTKDVDAIYKGSNLVYIAPFSWQSLSVNYLYYQLIPSIVNNKQVKNAARLLELQGNGVIENQLFPDTKQFYDNGNLTTSFDSTTKQYTFTTSSTSWEITNATFSWVSGHKYLVKINIVSKSSNCNFRVRYPTIFNTTSIITPTEYLTLFGIQLQSSDGNSATATFTIQITDITLMFGPGNEPTTLTDTRIQALLNRGYIAYNTGSYNSSEVGEIGFEPYNLFDGEWQLKTINPSSGEEGESSRGLSSVNHIPVLPNTSYIFEDGNISGYSYKYFDYYDKDKNFISSVNTSTTGDMTRTTPANCFFVKIYYLKPSGQSWTIPTNSQVCFHRTGTRTGYAPYTEPTKIQLPQPITLDGAMNAHNLFRVYADRYEFVRNVWYADLGTFNFVKDEYIYNEVSCFRFKCQINGIVATEGSSFIGNIVCPIYTTDTATNTYRNTNNKTCSLDSNSYVDFYDTTYASSTAADFKTAMSGKYLHYQLATPQTISIPKKHLGVVDLGSLNWIYDSSLQVFHVDSGNWKSQGGMYCSAYLTDTDKYASNLPNKTMTNRNYYTQTNLCIKDTSYTDAPTFKTAMSGIYIFYETEDEVADFVNRAKIEVGGTISAFEDDNGTDCSVLPNVEFEIKCSK